MIQGGYSRLMQDRWIEFQKCLKPVSAAPPLRRVNGFGVILLGRAREIPGSRLFIKGYWLTLLFIPIVPFSFYVVSGGFNEYRFHAKLSVFDFVKLYRWKTLSYIASVWIEAALRAALIIGVVFAVYGGLHWLFSLFR